MKQPISKEAWGQGVRRLTNLLVEEATRAAKATFPRATGPDVLAVAAHGLMQAVVVLTKGTGMPKAELLRMMGELFSVTEVELISVPGSATTEGLARTIGLTGGPKA